MKQELLDELAKLVMKAKDVAGVKHVVMLTVDRENVVDCFVDEDDLAAAPHIVAVAHRKLQAQ